MQFDRIGGGAGRTVGRVGALALSAGLLLSVGCGGHGQYTQEHYNAAKEKMDIMKSATEWEQARQAFLSGDLDKALKAVNRSIAINDKVTKSHVLRGRILMEMGEMEAAVNSLQTATKLDQTNAEAPYYLGIAFERFVQRERALEQYKAAADLDTANPQYVIAAAEMYIDLGRLDEAEAYLNARGTTFEHNAGVRQTLGHIAMIRGDATRGAALFAEARLLAPDDEAIAEDLVHAQIATAQFADAEYNISKLLQDPKNDERRDLRLLRARCLVHVNRLLDAREVLIKLTEGDAGAADAQAWIDLASVSYMLKDHTRARQASARAVALAPDRNDGYVIRGLQLRRDGDLNGARAALEKAAAIKAEAGPMVVLGMIQQELKLYDEARKSFEIAQRLDPSDQSLSGLTASVPTN